MCKITVFTPTYNRGYLLPRLYESLKKQTSKEFEWLIIDDESTDNTSDIVKKWIKEEKSFCIRYINQSHGGKHRALNKGFVEANGEYFFIVDSDDYLTNTAIEKVCGWVQDIESSGKKLAGVAGLRAYEDGNKIGGNPNISDKDYIDADCFERKKYNLEGDKAEIFKTEVLRQHLFPEFEGEFFVTEAVCWNAIYADGYKLRWYNDIIYICEYLDGGLTKSGMNELAGHVKNYCGYAYYVKQSIDLFGITNIPRLFKTYIKVAKEKNRSFSQMAKDLRMSKGKLLFNYIMLSFGYAKIAFGVIKKEGIKGIISRLRA